MIKLRRKEKEEVHVYTEALNDIMFFLMLFFIFAAVMSTRDSSIPVNTPSSKKASDSVHPQNQQVLVVKKDEAGNMVYFIQDQPISLEQIAGYLEKQKAEKGEKETMVLLKIDKDLTIQDLVDVMNITSQAGIKTVLSTKKQ